jgi:hypothetical protein
MTNNAGGEVIHLANEGFTITVAALTAATFWR